MPLYFSFSQQLLLLSSVTLSFYALIFLYLIFIFRRNPHLKAGFSSRSRFVEVSCIDEVGYLLRNRAIRRPPCRNQQEWRLSCYPDFMRPIFGTIHFADGTNGPLGPRVSYKKLSGLKDGQLPIVSDVAKDRGKYQFVC